jgi:hypothetical protein
MKVLKVQRPRSKVQSRKRAPRVHSDVGRWTLEFGLRLRPGRFGDRDGIALIITLIMLSIITFMAVTFLVLSQRERSSVNTAMDQKIARDATDTAFSRVSAELLTRMMVHTNFQDMNLIVSTNYYNAVGFHPTLALSPTNVNYEYLDGGGFNPFNNSQDWEVNIASLLYSPRPPVFVVTNAATGQAEFRFYVDLNRNGRFDRNGGAPVIVNDNAGKPSYVGTNGTLVSTNLPIKTYLETNYFVGDPEWIGVLARPEELHSADNQFISRFSYLVVPVGKTLDVNTMHNQAATQSVAPGNDGYMRNQGVGPWELNLAAFLTDLNTNIWPGPRFLGYNPPAGSDYQYNRPFNSPNQGLSFQDALSILSYRYNNNYASLFPANALFNSPAQLVADNIDEYSDGPIMTTTVNPTENAPGDPVGQPWAGAENTNHYFSQQDLFTRGGANFAARLQQAGASADSYDSYTFYRMLSQLGTDSSPEENKLNINFKNTDINGNIVPGMETNHILWTPADFFTNAANRILATLTNRDTGMGVPLSTHYIPIYPTNYYTPAVHRALQLAANIFDATTNQTVQLVAGQTNAFFPSVFRPIFTTANGQVFISGYTEVTNTSDFFNLQFWDFATLTNQPSGTFAGINVYGVPWVIGAKKGFPSFNQFAIQTGFALTRKLWFQRVATGGNPVPGDFSMLQEFVMTVTNTVGMDAWNSYQSAWPMNNRKLRLYGTNIFSVRIKNGTNTFDTDLITPQTIGSGSDIQPNSWPGFYPSSKVVAGTTPIATNAMKFLATSNYLVLNGNIVSYHPSIPGFRVGESYNTPVAPIPPFFIYTTNRVVYALIDQSANRIVDFVNLDDSGKMLDFTGTMQAQAKISSGLKTPIDAASVWRTNTISGKGTVPNAITEGLNYQIGVSLGNLTDPDWKGTTSDPNNTAAINGFNSFLLNPDTPLGATNNAPFEPTYGITNEVSWEANDPMVHYTIPDLTDNQSLGPDKFPWPPLKDGNHRYQPWNVNIDGTTDGGQIQPMAKKDAVGTADLIFPQRVGTSGGAWDFPTNKFWNVGILGRVHRGTPWQTVYMKSPIIQQKDWVNWSGDNVIVTNALTGRTNLDGNFTMPNADYALFDIFTTSPDPQASRGQLNVNQTNLASWSAVLSGVNVVSNDPNSGVMGSAFLPPAGVYDPANPTPVAKMWQGILAARQNTNFNKGLVFPDQTFQHVGDVLAAPELTVASPYAVPPGNPPDPNANDEVYERIPQQIMSLLTLNQTPRFVIYSFGQTLHPAANHPLVTGGTFNGLCTNYQITAESATRAVVRVEGTTDPKYVNGRVDPLGRSYPPHLVVEQFNVLGPD